MKIIKKGFGSYVAIASQIGQQDRLKLFRNHNNLALFRFDKTLTGSNKYTFLRHNTTGWLACLYDVKFTCTSSRL